MTTLCLWRVVLLASCATLVMSTPVDSTNGEKEKTKRSGYHCNVGGHIYRHGEIFSYPGYSHCIKYQCNNGGYNVVQSACERNNRCIPVGSVVQESCRSLRCVREERGNMNYYSMEPTVADRCELEGRCVRKNEVFEHKDCQSYKCVATPHGGYNFVSMGWNKCRDDSGRCISVGRTYSKWVNGHYYRNCLCLPGGGYQCRG